MPYLSTVTYITILCHRTQILSITLYRFTSPLSYSAYSLPAAVIYNLYKNNVFVQHMYCKDTKYCEHIKADTEIQTSNKWQRRSFHVLKLLLPVGIQYKDEVWRNHSVSSAVMQHAVWPVPYQNDFLRNWILYVVALTSEQADIFTQKCNTEQGMDLPKPQAEFQLITLVIKLPSTSLDHLRYIKLIFLCFYTALGNIVALYKPTKCTFVKIIF